MADIQDLSSGYSTTDYTANDQFIDTFGAIGDRSDIRATAIADRNSIPALLKGIAAGLGVSAGTGVGVVDLTPNLISDPVAAMGSPGDSASTDMSASISAISIAKGILTAAGYV